MRHAEAELVILKHIIDRIVAVGCPYCWVHDLVDPEPRPHTHHKLDGWFDVWFSSIQCTNFSKFKVWPICFLCWLPFRESFGHDSHDKGMIIDPSKCPHHDTIPKILPRVTALILTKVPEADRAKFLSPIAQDVGLDRWEKNWETPAMFCDWIKVEPKDQTNIPRHAKFLISYYRRYKKLEQPSDIDK